MHSLIDYIIPVVIILILTRWILSYVYDPLWTLVTWVFDLFGLDYLQPPTLDDLMGEPTEEVPSRNIYTYSDLNDPYLIDTVKVSFKAYILYDL
jgi:hypothetical protein